MKPHISIVAEWGECGYGHLSRAHALADGFEAIGCTAEVVNEPPAEGLVMYDTPARPLQGSPLRMEFWARIAIGLGGNQHDLAMSVIPPGVQACIIEDMTAAEVREVYDWADIAITNGGQSYNEARSTGLECAVIVTAEDQWHNIEDAIVVVDATDPGATRTLMRALVPWMDEGVAIAMRAIATVRPANRADVPALLDLANDTRDFSFNTGPISADEHDRFMDSHLTDTLISEVCGEWAGMVRFTDGRISIALRQKFRGMGLGRYVLLAALERASLPYVHAYVLPDNHPSRALFRGCGFTETEMDDAILYTLHHAGHEAGPDLR